MNEFLLPLESVRRADVAQVGGKAAPLGTLMAAGFPVPPGLCVTTTAFRQSLEQHLPQIQSILQGKDLRDPQVAQRAADRLAEQLTDWAIPTEVQDALCEMLPSIAPEQQYVSVRSSATSEDGTDVSFAGQYSTVLGVQGIEAISSAIIECWRSFFNANALAERARADILYDGEAMAILIQPMIHAECAGVCFSIDPVHNDRGIAVVNACWGLGTGVVDGAMAADTYRLNHDWFRPEESTIVEKKEQFVLNSQGSVERIAVDAERQRAACLPQPWLERIVQFGLAAEGQLGQPQDLEWAIADEQVWILQSRPITALDVDKKQAPDFPVQWEHPDERRYTWGVVPFLRHRPPLPIEVDYYECGAVADNQAQLFTGGRNKRAILQRFNGYFYVRQELNGFSDGDLRIRQKAMEDLGIRMRNEGKMLWDYWGPEVIATTERLHAFDADNADGPKRAEHLEDAFAAFRRHWMIHWMLWSSPRKELHQAYAAMTGCPESEAENAADQLVGGEDNLLTQLIDDLYELSIIARDHPSIATLVTDPPTDIRQRLSTLPEASSFNQKLEKFLDFYGDRTGKGFGSESDFFTATWREDPTLVFNLMTTYFDPNIEPPSEARARARKMRDDTVDALCDGCEDQEAVAEFRRQLAFVRREETMLEDHNHYIDQMAAGQLRQAVLIAASWLLEHGVIDEQDDVFWLYESDIVTALRADEPDKLQDLIRERKAQNAEWSKLEAPPILGTVDAKLPKRPPFKDEVKDDSSEAEENPNLLKGQAASPGIVQGRARVVSNTTLLPELSPGDIVVAENAGPAWTPFFPLLGGLVLDKGVLTQHGAATAREYGIPTVIQTKRATTRITDGAWLTVNGTEGTIEIE